MILGFTGTRRGLTDEQSAMLSRLLCELLPQEFHHGCCVGADEQAALLAVKMRPRPYVFGRPGDMAALTSKVAKKVSNRIVANRPNLERNRAIVDASVALVACPAETTEQQRSGTWSTVRYARRAGKPVYLVLPDGSVVRPEVAPHSPPNG